ncbi:unnamed protein product [Clonostachys rosea]|uniref:Uncharacterized protein n=1 Tax=Bionectria ochroleuca TaxID=29856 RepID=A0ABY6UXX2_BIOOC|nr:unnamed protein product [Clonostachys rosea]
MRFSLNIVSAIFGMATLSSAMPSGQLMSRAEELSPVVVIASNGEIESHANATALGVDIFGPIPDDHTKVDDHIVADPGSKAYAWIRARIDVDWDKVSDDVKVADYANIGVGMWTSTGCKFIPSSFLLRILAALFGSGSVSYWSNIEYNPWFYWNTASNLYSVGTDTRAFSWRERLDLYRRTSSSNQCGTYTEYVQGPAGPGCWNGGPFNCFSLKIVA